ncbi:hypothetical protein RJ641_015898 [Dillenia turbinata]|uniref:Bifunctional inhibitor/plant lipid transfer protein/seed storage helical domain-containing protein n=1 Tax=Dillenia turbinata TaxID=194707 RepID=A0AAN8YYL3_9MAGN
MKWVGGYLALLLVASSYATNGENESDVSALSYGTVDAELAPCLSYIKNRTISGLLYWVKNVAGQAKSKGDRQAICNCIKQRVGGIGSYDVSRMPQIPKKCGASVNLPPIDKNCDCSKLVHGATCKGMFIEEMTISGKALEYFNGFAPDRFSQSKH